MKGIPNTKHIRSDKRYGTFFIQKKVNGKDTAFGSYSSLEEAIKWRDYFEENGWGNCYEERLEHTSRKPTYIVYLKKQKLFRIVKRIKGKVEVFGHFKNRSDAEKEVELLKKANWDWETLCDLYE